MSQTLFLELGLLIIVATIFSGIMRALKQPLIIGYILTGLVASTYFSNIIQHSETISILSQVGIIFLLFIIGLSLNPRIIKGIGFITLLIGVLQVVITFGVSLILEIFIAAAISFSSTIIVLKLLSDKQETGTLHGKISVSILIIQDLFAIISLILIAATAKNSDIISIALSGFLKGAILVLILFLIAIYLLPKLNQRISSSQEFLFLFSISWCFALAILFKLAGLSGEIGALIAGITLSLSPYHYEISSKVKPLRDFFIIIFFVLLGSQINLANISTIIIPAIIISAFVILIKPIIILIIMGILGYTKKTSFITGLNLAQVSEFSLILCALAFESGRLSESLLSMITLVALITIAISTYMITYSNSIYNIFSSVLSTFERKGKKRNEGNFDENISYKTIIFGFNRTGSALLSAIKKLSKKYLIIEFNPEIIKELEKKKIHCRYGDAQDVELLNELNLSKTKLIISTIPNLETNMLLVKKARNSESNPIVIVVTHHHEDTIKLYEEGADYVIMPYTLSGEHAANLINKIKFNKKLLEKERKSHLKKISLNSI